MSAQDKATGKAQTITVTASTNLNKEDVERMVRQAEINKAADQRRKELIEARNQADQMAYVTEKSLRDLPEDNHLNPNDRRAIEQLIADLRKAAQGEDVTAIRDAMSRLQEASSRMAQAAYSQAPSGNGHGQPDQQHSDDDVVEGEFRQV